MVKVLRYRGAAKTTCSRGEIPMAIARRALTVLKGVAFVCSLLMLRAYAQEPGGKQVAQAKMKAIMIEK